MIDLLLTAATTAAQGLGGPSEMWGHIVNDFSNITEPAAMAAFMQVLLIDLVLAGDNAIVVGALAAGLPADQRRKVIIIGVLAALVLRIGFALVVTQLLQIVGLIFIGGLLLVWVAWKMWRELREGAHSAGSPEVAGDGHSGLKPAKSFAAAAWAVAIADVSMSLDNVLAVAGAARDHPGIMIVGLIVAVILMGVAANIIAKYIERYRWIAYIGLAVILFVALRMIYEGWVGTEDVQGLTTLFAWLSRGQGAAVVLLVILAGLVLTALAVATVAGLIYAGLRKRERTDVPDDSLPDEAVLRAIADDENHAVQNHMTGVSRMKPGRLRRFMLRLAFWAIGKMAARKFRPGFLGDIGTIHFARWVLLPGTDQLLFFSNYGGSWESYLEDFITKAHGGLTAVWSNTEGYPRTSNLVMHGATDGDRFKRWARRQQQPTSFWYAAYPHITTARVRANAAIRQGLASANTREEAELWLAQLGSQTPPASLLETREIQTLLFGGLKHHPHGTALVIRAPASPEKTRTWLAAVRAHVGFGDVPDPKRVGLLALAPGALAKAGLSPAAMASFGFAFREGVASHARSRILEDTGDDQPAQWIWGSGESAPDAALVLYGSTANELKAAEAQALADLTATGGEVLHQVALRTLGQEAQESGTGRRNQDHEAFGFADGVSQPIIKGTRRWRSEKDAIHEVEAGEFILGYPDNRGYLPLTPTVAPETDAANLLPTIAPPPPAGYAPELAGDHAALAHDLGRNGTYLVIRQLAQDVKAFNASVDHAANACAGHPGVPAGFDAAKLKQWIAAKIIGRWRDGTSLVRYPYRPGAGWDGKLDAEPDNAFLLGAEDPVGQRCPFGAHVRRTNPRDSLDPGSAEQLAITNRHRILRAGRPYPAYKTEAGEESEGLWFMCFNADIERQFEFIQQTWSMAPQFHGLENEVDAILGRGEKNGRLTIPTPHGPVQVKGLRDVVRVRGGGYFFVPSKSALDYLCALT